MSTSQQRPVLGRSSAVAPRARGDERRERSDRSEEERAGGATAVPDPEVPAKATRRRFTAEYKLRILREADACKQPGEVGALLRREGLYTSHLAAWRKQRESGVLKGLAPRKRGRKAKPRDPVVEENAKLRRENERLQARLKAAETIIAAQKKVSEMLGIPLAQPPNDESDS
jgi:transposase-like protein